MLRATFYGFNIAASGMFKAQKALDLTGNNMVNMDTLGYTRQRLDLNSIPSSNYTDRYAPYNNVAIGQGVNVSRVSQLRDPFLDARFRREASNIGELDAKLSAMSDIARIFDEVQFDMLDAALRDFLTSLQVYSSQTGEVTIDSTVMAKADSIIKLLRMYANQLDATREYHETVLRDSTVPEVNKILENIAMLNKNIRECEIYGNPALELKDMRNLELDRLSAYMKIEVQYVPDPDPYLSKIGVEICKISLISDNSVGISERLLVDGQKFATLGYEKDPDTGDSRIYRAKGLDGNPVTDWTGQQLYYASVPPSPLQVPVLDKDGNHMASPAGFGYYYPTGDPAVDNTAPKVNTVDQIKFNAGALKGALEMLNSKGAFDTAVNAPNGIGYYERMLDTLVNDFALKFNESNQAPSSEYIAYMNDPDYKAAWSAYWDAREAYAAANNVDSGTRNPYRTDLDLIGFDTPDVFFASNPPYDALAGLWPPALPQFEDRPLFQIDNVLDPTFTAKNIEIATGWKTGAYSLTTTKKIPIGPEDDVSGDTSNLLYMISLFSKTYKFTTTGIDGSDPGTVSLYNGTFAQMFANLGFTAAQDEYSNTKSLEANTQVIMGIEDSRNSLSSVSMDEEGVNLLRFQKSYAAAARVMTTLDEALDVLINRMGIVGR